MRRPLKARSIVGPPGAHHHVLSVELARGQRPRVRRRPQRVCRRSGHVSVGAARVRPTGLMRGRTEVASCRRRILGHGSAAGHVDRGLLDMLMETGTVVAVTA